MTGLHERCSRECGASCRVWTAQRRSCITLLQDATRTKSKSAGRVDARPLACLRLVRAACAGWGDKSYFHSRGPPTKPRTRCRGDSWPTQPNGGASWREYPIRRELGTRGGGEVPSRGGVTPERSVLSGARAGSPATSMPARAGDGRKHRMVDIFTTAVSWASSNSHTPQSPRSALAVSKDSARGHVDTWLGKT